MAVLVTGGAGYIGSHMVWSLLDAGEEVVVLDKLLTGFRWAIAPEARFYYGDAGDQDLLARIFSENDITAIFHFAGSVVIPESIANPLFYYDNNTGKTRNLIAAAVRANINKFIFSSTAAVYPVDGDGSPISEDVTPQPVTPYGQSKLMSELMLKDTAAAHDFSYVALRYFNVAGSDHLKRTGQSTLGATHLVKVVCETAMGRRDHVDVFGTDYPTRDGTAIRDFIHVNDLVDAHLQALKYLRDGGRPLVANCGYGQGFTVREVIETVRSVTGREFEVRQGPRRKGDAAQIVSDPTVARTVLGWVPRHADLEYIIETTLQWEDILERRNRTSHHAMREIQGLLSKAAS